MSTSDRARRLRALPSLTGSAPPFDLAALPADPVQLFAEWLEQAVDGGVPEPLAVTVATVDATGLPDARTVLLKDVGDDGWAVAGRRSAALGSQLAARPAAALSFWWQPIVRAVRVRGSVVEASADDSAADLAARSPAARAGVAPGDWVLWRVRARHVEFWQGSTDRDHRRVAYDRDGDDGPWRRTIFGG